MSLSDMVLVDDNLQLIPIISIDDSSAVDDRISKTVFYRLYDEALTDDSIAISYTMSLSDMILVDDRLGKIPGKSINDSATIDDRISKTVFYRMYDSALTEDDVFKIVIKVQTDQVLIDDAIRKTIIKQVNPDSVSVDDRIYTTVFQRLTDGVTIDDRIVKIVIKLRREQVLIDDAIRKTIITQVNPDSVSISDRIYKTVFQELFDEVSIQDDIVKISFILPRNGILIDDILSVRIVKFMDDAAVIDDRISKTVFYRISDSILVLDGKFKLVFKLQTDQVSIDDRIRITPVIPLEDSATINDRISKTVFYRIADEISVQDDINLITFFFAVEAVLIDDRVRTTIIKFTEDVTLIDDRISKTVFYRMYDEVTPIEDLLVVAPVTFVLEDAATVDDRIRITPIFSPEDSATINDRISKTVFYRMYDEVTPIEDLLVIAPVTFVLSDTATVDDTITWTLTRAFGDEVAVDDSIRWTLTRVLDDEIAFVDDSIAWTLTRAFGDSASVDDSMRWTLTRAFGDEVAVDDILRATTSKTLDDALTIADTATLVGAINIENRDENGNLIMVGSQYRILPNPFDGTAFLDVTDGGPNDNDGLANNGQINVFPVPLDTYRVNQTAPAPPTYFSLINFTYVTVHQSDNNATALFSVFDKTLNPADLGVQNSDILDIANFTFNEIANKLIKVENGIQTPIIEVDDMPAPLFIGANNFNGAIVEADAQPTILYQDLGLIANASPETIRNSFAQTSYDAGNFTETTFVGVFAATETLSRSNQFLSTIPVDKFNCGQRYVYGLDETVIPFYGGLTLMDLTVDANGVCPESEDYITFEIAIEPPTGSGVPKTISDRNTQLYVNPEFPQGSVTADGVDFSSAANVTSVQFRLVTGLSVTENIDDIEVHIFDTDWTRTGVDIISRQLITSGPNTGMAELMVTATHLEKLLVSGILIPGTQGNPPTGTGLVGVGPSRGVAGGGGDIATARVHRIDYDVCDENISRILVAHDSATPPKIQLLTTKSGIIDATLVSDQPFAEQNKVTLFDKYLFEAPLAQGESIFTVFAIDRNSNVQRTLVEVDGCTGTIIFVDDKIVLPDIFDFKYQIENNTAVRLDTTEHHYIEETQDLKVSVIVNSPIVPLRKADLYIKTLGDVE